MPNGTNPSRPPRPKPRGLYYDESRGRLLPIIDDMYQAMLLQYERLQDARMYAGIAIAVSFAWVCLYGWLKMDMGPAVAGVSLLTLVAVPLGFIVRTACKFYMDRLIPQLHDLDTGRYTKEPLPDEQEDVAS